MIPSWLSVSYKNEMKGIEQLSIATRKLRSSLSVCILIVSIMREFPVYMLDSFRMNWLNIIPKVS